MGDLLQVIIAGVLCTISYFTVERIEENKFVINDMSESWICANVDKQTLIDLVTGKKSLENLIWY